jgi:hypothetical protein
MRALVLALLCASCGGSGESAESIDPNEGKKGGPCYPNNTCNAGLSCASSTCVETADEALPTDTSSPTDTAKAADTTPKSPYTQSAITGSCDDTMLTDVLDVVADDAASKKTALPFAFTFFGSTVTHWSMSSNGFAQLWPDGTGAADTTRDNVSLPSASAPKGLLSAFWDDLEPIYSNARAGVLGTAPNRRFVISWVHWSIKGQSSTVRVSFQIKLFETSNAIELHYCGMAPAGNAFASGSSATIGLQDLAGAAAVQQSFNVADAVASGKAFRFAP